MARKAYGEHRGKGKATKHVQLPEWVQASEAWKTLKPGPRALYIELKRRFNGRNNGHIILSHRSAAAALNVNRNTVGSYFSALVERGFIRETRGHCLGPSGVGEAAHWALEELPLCEGQAPPKSFMRWRQGDREKQNPRTKNRTPRPEKQDGGQKTGTLCAGAVPKNGTLSR